MPERICNEHKQPYMFYCRTCDAAHCPVCCTIPLTSGHHDLVMLDDESVISTTLSRMHEAKIALDAEKASVTLLKESFDDLLGKFQQQRAFRLNELTESFQSLRSLLDQTETRLRFQVDESEKRKLAVVQQEAMLYSELHSAIHAGLGSADLAEEALESADIPGFVTNALTCIHAAEATSELEADPQQMPSLGYSQVLDTTLVRQHLITLMLTDRPLFESLDWEADKQLRDVLGPEKRWDLIYRASQHGYDAGDFHKCCDGKGPTVTIIFTPNGFVFGGYTTIPWKSGEGEFEDDGNTFLFSIARPGTPTEPYGMTVMQQGSMGAVMQHKSYGPIFGVGHDIFIDGNPHLAPTSHSTLGKSFDVPPHCDPRIAHAYLAGTKDFIVSEIEVYLLV